MKFLFLYFENIHENVISSNLNVYFIVAFQNVSVNVLENLRQSLFIRISRDD